MPVTDLEKLPLDTEEMRKLEPEFPRLENDSPKGCPRSMNEIRQYVIVETGEKGHDLFFGRTALVGDVRFWLWGYTDEKGRTEYVDVSSGRGTSSLSMGSGDNLTPEQYIALQYARYWRDEKKWRALLRQKVDAAASQKVQPSVSQTKAVAAELARLQKDSPEGCPFSVNQIRRSLKAQAGWKGDLVFERTAVIGDVRFWLWRCVDGSSVTSYVLVAGTAEGEAGWLMGMKNSDGLTPEQYIAREYALNFPVT
jgi:hypothetical protein